MFEPGSVLLDKYRIDQIIGRGGMGVVARAHHLQLDVPVAIKFLHRKVLDRRDMVQRFLREAQAAVKLRSEHVSRIIDVGTLDDGTPYIVMEYLRGTDLGHLLRVRGPLAPGLAVDLVLQACDALAEAHALGIVHRDIKPSNLFLTQGPDGAPLLKVVDFGVSKAPFSVDEDITHSSAIMGTPVYMSPEQMESSKHVDGRTDIWSMGVVLYQLVSGRLPFRAESFAGLVLALATQRMRPLDDVALAPGLVDVIERCIERDVTRRFQTMAELASALTLYASAPDEAARWTARTLRVLAHPQSAAHLLADVSAGESVEDDVRGSTESPAPQVSTIGQSMGEQLVSGNTRPTRPMKGALGVTSTALAVPEHVATSASPRRRRGLLVGAAALGLVGATVAIASLMRGGGDEPARARSDTVTNMPAREGERGLAAPPPGVTPDAGPAAERGAPARVPDARTEPTTAASATDAGRDARPAAGKAAAASRDTRARARDPRPRRGAREDERPRSRREPAQEKDVIDSVFGTRQ